VKPRELERLRRELGELEDKLHGATPWPDLSGYAGRACAFAEEVPRATLLTWQRETLDALDRERLLAVASCNGAGKTALAPLALLYVAAVLGAKAVFLSANERTARTTMVRELKRWVRAARLPCDVYHHGLETPNGGLVLVLSPAEMEAAAGQHDPDLIVIVDEASALEDPIFQALMGNVVSERNRLVMLGNPLRASGPFATALRATQGWWRRTITAAEVMADAAHARIPGLISAAGVNALRQTFGEESAVFASRVHARLPVADADALYPEALLMAAVERWRDGSLRRRYATSRLKAGLDLAASEDGDASALAVSFGGAHVEAIHTMRSRDTMRVAGWAVETLRAYNARRANSAIGRAANERGLTMPGDPTVLLRDVSIYGDEIAWGKGCLDRLKEAGYPAHGINVSRRPADEEKAAIYANERARIAYAFREKLVRGTVAIPPDDELLEELRAYKAFANSAGKQQCVSKGELRSVLGRSPDKMDAVLLATCADVAPTFDGESQGAVAF
jgi:phage terminase large subunit